MNKIIVLLLSALLLLPSFVLAQPTIDELQAQIADIMDELDELSDRLDPVERKTTMDRISFYGDLRATVDSIHYSDVTYNPGIKVDFNHFFTEAAEGMGMAVPGGDGVPTLGVFGATFNPMDPAGGGDPTTPLDNMFFNLQANDPDAFTQLTTNFANWMGAGMPNVEMTGPFRLRPAPATSDINNDLAYTTRLRLGMKAQIADNMNFAGRLLMYKNWGDSTSSKVFDSWDAFSMDGTNGGKTSGDTLRVERAFFNWKHIGGTDFYLSIGRRPSTYGSPSNYRVNEMRGGTPSGHLVDFNFDGVTIGYHLDKVTGIPGQAVRLCYGQGFESEIGNGTLYNDSLSKNLKDTHLGGFNLDLFNDGKTLVQATLFRAQDVVDGFKGILAFPTQMAETFTNGGMYDDLQKFPNMNFEVRYTPTTVIGDINLVQLSIAREESFGLSWFASVGMTELRSNGEAGMFGGMGNDAIYEATMNNVGTEIYMKPVRAENDDTNTGYGVYVGVQIPAPMGKVGLEYNYGSEFWTPFTQNQDDLVGAKLSTRGHVGEIYYIFDINKNAFITVGGLYYDYVYTGSGSPVGAPQKVEDVKDGTAYSMLPVVDTAWDAYAKITMKF